jgi:hypothetical protein
MGFQIQNITDNSIIEIISMNIDNENNILILQDNELGILSIADFKDMAFGANKNPDRPNEEAKPATYRLVIE